MKTKSTCMKCHKETKELFTEKLGAKIVCGECYDLNDNNPPRKDDSYFKEHLVRRR